ncbi:MAG: flavin reductase family protein [Chloroflexota bacterium]|nr:flavin reductase family protein [Chloroflexota bacterium]
MVRRLCDEADARRLLQSGPVTIMTVAWRGMTNAAPVAWTVPLSIQPPLVACVLHPDRLTGLMARHSEEFALNIPGPGLAKQVAFLGSITGIETNKIEAARLTVFGAQRIDAPLIDGCLAWIECGLESVTRFGDHDLYVGRVLRVQALDEAYVQTWKLESPEYSPLVFLGGNRYAVLGSPVEVTFATDEQGGLVVETPEEREQREEREARLAELRKLEGEALEERLRLEQVRPLGPPVEE